MLFTSVIDCIFFAEIVQQNPQRFPARPVNCRFFIHYHH
ncbi:hypothetical protein yberc0001_3130 [Yersinia bercovieri ATCC 43970]|uniref:Uncharacterized protein n=1 Tax=Yersinia bercovieri ATCC 43970 TaxID=349968 RepID=A0ABP2E6I9_YERBE|nr:hypothetical protein yberc0001_3130 [Yersinia bercovieri ATCC 43970]